MKKVGYLLVLVGLICCYLPASLPAQDAAVATAPVVTAPIAPAQDAPGQTVSREELAKESEAACAESAKDKATTEAVIKKVDEACKLVETEGRKAFPKFMGKDSSFIFAGTYIWIHDLEGVMQMHPLKYKMEGNALLILKDKNGKRFFVEMNKVAQEVGAGWVDYYWPLPGSTEIQRKVSYVKLCETPEKEKLVVGCGIYGLSDAEIEKLVAAK